MGSFDDIHSRWLGNGCQEPRIAQCSALRDSRSLRQQLRPRGHWARSGKLSSGGQQFAGVVGVAPRVGAVSLGASDLAEREQFACDAVLAGCAGRHGEEQRAPGASDLASENNLLAMQSLLGVLAVMARSSVPRVDGGRLAPCRERLSDLSMHVCFLSIPR